MNPDRDMHRNRNRNEKYESEQQILEEIVVEDIFENVKKINNLQIEDACENN